MKRKLLILPLLLGLAQAQTTTPTPATTTSTPATSTPTPAASAPIFTLSAPVGTSLEFTTTTTTRMTLTDVQVTRAPGSKVTDAQLNEARRSLMQGTQKASTSTTLTGKAFYRVTGRDVAGNTTLVNTVVQNVPATAGQKAQTIEVKYTQTLTPDGQVKDVSITSSTPMLQAIFSKLTPDKVAQMAQQNGTSSTGIYGTPLIVGQPRTTTLTLDGQDLMQTVMNSLAGPRGEKIFGQVQANPLTVTTTTTYQGQDAQGRHTFQSEAQYANWKISMTSQDAQLPMTINAELLDVKASTASAFLPGGLPASSETNLNQRMKMTMQMDGIQFSMIMVMQQTTSMKPR